MSRNWEVELYCDGNGKHRAVTIAVPMSTVDHDGLTREHMRFTPAMSLPDADAADGGTSRTAYHFRCARCALDWRPPAIAFWQAVRKLGNAGVSRVDARALMGYIAAQKP